ncbi:MAG: hypothetical protein R3C11_05545 [Planctomycetaceae bacterium]
MLAFNDIAGDSSFHVMTAAHIQEYGLPRIDTYGAGATYAPLGHVGFSTLIAGKWP